METLVLRHPRGGMGYVMKIVLDPSLPRLYVKLELAGGRVVGRSFHYSRHRENPK